MDLSSYVDRLRDDLTAAAAAGDEQTRRAAALLATALEPAARMVVMNALSDLTTEVTALLDDRVVQLRLDGRDVQVALTRPETGGDAAAPAGAASGDISRITLRLFEQLKSRAERSAAEQGVSLNTWVSQAVQGALRDEPAGSAPGAEHRQRRVQGWVRG